MSRRAIVAALAVVVLTACNGEPESTLEVRAYGSVAEGGPLAGLVVTVGEFRLTADDFLSEDGSRQDAVRIRVADSGRLDIGVELIEGARTVASGDLGWDLRPGYEWGLDVFRRVDDPADLCLGCRGSVRIPLEEAAQHEPGEAIWVVWAGQKKDSDVVY